MTAYLLLGITLGLTAGISPGPLLVMVISETLKHNRKEGILIACSPLITDLPIVLLSLIILIKFSGYSYFLGILSFIGAIYIGYLAFDNIKQKGLNLNTREIKARSLKKGVIANFLNPQPYLFWITIGVPTVLKGYKSGLFVSICFICGFYVFLVGSKIFIAVAVEKSKMILQSRFYIIIIKLLGFILLLFSVFLIREGLVQFNIF